MFDEDHGGGASAAGREVTSATAALYRLIEEDSTRSLCRREVGARQEDW